MFSTRPTGSAHLRILSFLPCWYIMPQCIHTNYYTNTYILIKCCCQGILSVKESEPEKLAEVCVITKDVGGTILRNFEKPNERKFRAKHAAFPIGTTPIMKQARQSLCCARYAIKFKDKAVNVLGSGHLGRPPGFSLDSSSMS